MSYNSRKTNLKSDYEIWIFEYKAHPVILFVIFCSSAVEDDFAEGEYV